MKVFEAIFWILVGIGLASLWAVAWRCFIRRKLDKKPPTGPR